MNTNTRWAVMKSFPEIVPNCPKCASFNTKFCYYNNYSLSQPRYFCKGCRRYWTKGGSLRSVPIGGGCRKSRREGSSKPFSSSTDIIPSYTSRTDGNEQLTKQDAIILNGHDIDIAAVFAKFLDPNSDAKSMDQETDITKDNTSPLESNNNEEESILIDCHNSDTTKLFGQEMIHKAGDETFELSYDASFGLDDLHIDHQVTQCPEDMWPSYGDNLDTEAFCGFCQSTVNSLSQEECLPFSFPDDVYNQTKGLDSDQNWSTNDRCFDASSYEVFSTQCTDVLNL